MLDELRTSELDHLMTDFREIEHRVLSRALAVPRELLICSNPAGPDEHLIRQYTRQDIEATDVMIAMASMWGHVLDPDRIGRTRREVSRVEDE
jgi:hypothetical protein